MILMRTLRKDYARYSRDTDLDEIVSGGSLFVFWYSVYSTRYSLTFEVYRYYHLSYSIAGPLRKIDSTVLG